MTIGNQSLHQGAPVLPDDWERVQVLEALRILDSKQESSFDRITEACSNVFKVRNEIAHYLPQDTARCA